MGCATGGARPGRATSVLLPKFATYLAADASRLAALLVAYISPICALLAPCDPGASTTIYAPNFSNGTLADDALLLRGVEIVKPSTIALSVDPCAMREPAEPRTAASPHPNRGPSPTSDA